MQPKAKIKCILWAIKGIGEKKKKKKKKKYRGMRRRGRRRKKSLRSEGETN